MFFCIKYNNDVYNVLQRNKLGDKKTEVTSFRLEIRMLEELRKISRDEQVSLNTLVSQIFDQYLNWNYTATRASFIPLPKTMLVKMLEKMDDDEIMEIVDYVAETQIKSLMMVTRKEYTVEAFIKGVEYWTKTSNLPSSHVEKSNGVHQYIIQHDMGKKWSFYYRQLFKKIFEQLGVKKLDIDTTDSTLIFTLDHS